MGENMERTPPPGTYTLQADSQFQSVTTMVDFTQPESGDIPASETQVAVHQPTHNCELRDTIETAADGDLQRKQEPLEEIDLPDRHEIPGSEVREYLKIRTEKLKACLAKRLEGAFEAGDLLRVDERKLDRQEFKKLWKDAGLKSVSNVNNYIRIARAKHLRKPELGFPPTTPGTQFCTRSFNDAPVFRGFFIQFRRSPVSLFGG